MTETMPSTTCPACMTAVHPDASICPACRKRIKGYDFTVLDVIAKVVLACILLGLIGVFIAAAT